MHTSKEKVRCVMVVDGWRIEGDVHVLSGSRLTDTLNAKPQGFFAVTDAVISDLASGEVLYTVAYAAVNRATASVIFPLD